MTKARQLTEAGIRRAVAFLDDVRNIPSATLQVPQNLLYDSTFSRPMPDAPNVEHCQFVTRRDAAEHLDRLSPALGKQHLDDWAFWSWLGIYHLQDVVFNELRRQKFATSTSDSWTTETETIVIDPESSEATRASYRHYLRSAWLINRNYGEQCAFLLNQDITDLPRITRLILSSLRVFNSVGVVPLVLKLYTDQQQQKRGLSIGPGNIGRLFHVLDQLECTYDVYGMSTKALIEILPPEFDRWKPQGVMA